MKSIIRNYLSGKSSVNEKKALLLWIREDGRFREFQEVKKEWMAEVATEAIPAEYAGNWQNIQNRMMEYLQNEVQQKQRALVFVRYAAALLVLVSMSVVIYFQMNGKNKNLLSYTTVKADNGQISKISLPDSTEIWVNSGSSVRYNNQFSMTNRDIILSGEAYFKVHKNKDLPLIVSNGELRVKVLGTEFSVSAYPEDTNIQVVLEKGHVELNSISDQNFRKEMKPGEIASFNKSNKNLEIQNVNTNLYTSWKNGTINIYNLPLSELVVRLEKRYNQKFKVDEKIKNIPFTFTIKNETLSEILNLIEKITPIEAIQRDNFIELNYNKSKGIMRMK